MSAPSYNPLDRSVQQDPYPHYEQLRKDHPVIWLDSLQAYVVSRYCDVQEVLTNKEKYTSENFWDALVGEFNPVPDATWLISVDGPDHLRLRRLANKAFAPARFADMKLSIEKIVNGLLDDCVAKGESFDFAQDFAWLYPANVVAEILGVDPSMRSDFKTWVDEFLNAANRERMTPEEYQKCKNVTETMKLYFEKVIEERRIKPGNDLISAFIQAEDDGKMMNQREVLANAILLLTGGVETTSNLTGSIMTVLAERPDVYQQVKEEPSLIANLIEETLRYSSPVQILFRDALVDSEVSGVTIPKGARILILTGSANRDESVFTEPEKFDLHRPKAELDKIMSFGAGVHFCLGAQLARFESTIALKAVLQRFSYLELQNMGCYSWIESYFARGPLSLPVKYQLAAA